MSRMKFLLVLILILGGLPHAGHAAESPKVGVARIDITPDYPVRLHGFGFRREESAGVRQRLAPPG